MQGIIAVVGSVIISAGPIWVMLVRSLVEAIRWRSIVMARAWIAAWFAGPGIIVTAGWIVAIIAIRLITDAFLAELDSVQVMSWVLVGAAMLAMIPFAIRTPKERED